MKEERDLRRLEKFLNSKKCRQYQEAMGKAYAEYVDRLVKEILKEQ